MIEKGGKAHDVRVGVLVEPSVQAFDDIFARFFAARVKGQILFPRPVVGDIVVHLRAVPDRPREEGHRILMKFFAISNRHDVRCPIGRPIVRGHYLARRAVDHFPIFTQIAVVLGLYLLPEIPAHNLERKRIPRCRYILAAHEKVRPLVGHGLCKPVVAARHKVRGIHLITRPLDFVGHRRAVAVAHRVRAPALQKLQRLFDEPRLGGYRKSAAERLIFHNLVSFLHLLPLYAADGNPFRELPLHAGIYDQYGHHHQHQPRVHSA